MFFLPGVPVDKCRGSASLWVAACSIARRESAAVRMRLSLCQFVSWIRCIISLSDRYWWRYRLVMGMAETAGLGVGRCEVTLWPLTVSTNTACRPESFCVCLSCSIVSFLLIGITIDPEYTVYSTKLGRKGSQVHLIFNGGERLVLYDIVQYVAGLTVVRSYSMCVYVCKLVEAVLSAVNKSTGRKAHM